MATLLKFKPIQWHEEAMLHCSWWPRSFVAALGRNGAGRTWTMSRLGVRAQIVEVREKGIYILYVEGQPDYDSYSTLSDAQEAAAEVVARRVRDVLQL